LIKRTPTRIAGPSTVVVRKAAAGVSESTLVQFVRRAQRALGLRGEVNILIAGNSKLRELNFQFRNRREPTDVLSFPATNQNGFVGDLAISVDFAIQNAHKLGHMPAEETKILILHGLLHLAGYDHEKDNGEMAKRELRLRKQLDLPGGLIERYQVSAQKRGSAAKRKTQRSSNRGKGRESE
jgi:probable rRNA maturation factor